MLDEVVAALRLMRVLYEAPGYVPSSYRLSLRGDGDKYVDDPPMWSRATAVLRDALAAAGVSYVEAPGEAAFYGPKIDVQLVDPPDARAPWRPSRWTTPSQPGSICPMWTLPASGAGRSRPHGATTRPCGQATRRFP
ncbi:hypothetical protein Drose_04665 [Dactylosporangium roseum]|uniref:Uncharacterized protein n=1 Tax=Dactylosporangium roseum TaxID=47989 RepID=A0ABY5Z696_9ACTN|nr:hypothetical protein [Dactylosporangium roseum]UWZ37581.1 hypothetical protein Drose_04665 [Dactylosporangium roseum]